MGSNSSFSSGEVFTEEGIGDVLLPLDGTPPPEGVNEGTSVVLTGKLEKPKWVEKTQRTRCVARQLSGSDEESDTGERKRRRYNEFVTEKTRVGSKENSFVCFNTLACLFETRNPTRSRYSL